jgi:hypothetical protein
LKVLGRELRPPSARKVPILANFEADSKKIYMLFWAGTNVYLDIRLPWPAKIAAGMLAPEKWWSFEIYLPNFHHTYLDVPNAELNDFFTKTKEASSVSYRITWT